MVDQNPIRGSGATPGEPRPVERPAGKVAGAEAHPTTVHGPGPAFQALLEKLEQQARGLEQASQVVSEPEHLADAMDHARTSLDAALSLSDTLLEAYRAARQNPEA